MIPIRRKLRQPCVGVALMAAVCALRAWADEKLIVLDDIPRDMPNFEVKADGSRLYFSGGPKYHVFDANAKLVDKFGVPQASSPRELIPLPDGWFISCASYANGHLALYRPDGTLAKQLVGKGGDEKVLHSDMTGWTSPCGAAVDFEHKRLFAIDTSMAPRDVPDPVWSRIAVFDFDGKFIASINHYDGNAKEKDDARRTWYDDIEVDPARERVYVTARSTKELLAFSYDGQPQGKAPGARGIAVFPDGRVAVGTPDGRGIQVYDPNLTPLRMLEVGGLQDLEADGEGRLYASIQDPSITFIRWSADLETREVLGPRFLRLNVEFPDTDVTAGEGFAIKTRIEGRPEITKLDLWHVMARPSDGTDLRWQPLQAKYNDGMLTVTTPATLRGFYEIAVRFGEGPIAWADRQNDPYLQKTFAFLAPGATRSIAVFTASGRRVFQQGEAIPVQIVCRDAGAPSVVVRFTLERGGASLASREVTVDKSFSGEVTGALTRRLAPGDYLLKPAADGYGCYALPLCIAAREPDSPMQRITYNEFENAPPLLRQHGPADVAEAQAYIRDYVRETARLGFTRETDRMVGSLNVKSDPRGWRRDAAPASLSRPGYAPAEFYAIPTGNANWEAEYYLDQSVRYGLKYDSQLLGHCAGVRFREYRLRGLVPILQRTAQWLRRYPSFYGFNYNDEMFFGGFASEWTKDDEDWLKQVQ